jgi:purine nucleosidase
MGDNDQLPRPTGEPLARGVRREHDAFTDLGQVLPGSVYARLAASAPDDGGRRGAPMIVDTDLGGDADDAVALAVAALQVPELALVTTVDETTDAQGGPGLRARAARWLLDAAGRIEVPVVAGAAAAGGTDHFSLDDGDLARVSPQGGDVVAAIRSVAARFPSGPLRWVGIGPLSNLARVVDEAPELAARLVVTQMGAAIDYRHPDRAEHNVRLDVPAAHTVFAAAGRGGFADVELVISDVTFTPALEISPGAPRHQAITSRAGAGEGWAQVVAACLQRWFDDPHGHRGTIQHDALTLSAALEQPFVRSTPMWAALDEIGRMRETGPGRGARVRVARSAHYDAFWRWLDHALGLDEPPAAAAPTPAPRHGASGAPVAVAGADRRR